MLHNDRSVQGKAALFIKLAPVVETDSGSAQDISITILWFQTSLPVRFKDIYFKKNVILACKMSLFRAWLRLIPLLHYIIRLIQIKSNTAIMIMIMNVYIFF